MKSLVEQGVSVVEERMKQYGPPLQNFKDIAGMWSVILGTGISPMDVAHCMIALKMCREKYKHSDDNLVDIAGYTRIAEMFEQHPEAYEPVISYEQIRVESDDCTISTRLDVPIASRIVDTEIWVQVISKPFLVKGEKYRICVGNNNDVHCLLENKLQFFTVGESNENV